MVNAPTIKLSNPIAQPTAAEHVGTAQVGSFELALTHVQARRAAPENQPMISGENNAVFVIRPDEAGNDEGPHTVFEYADPAWLETSNAGNYELEYSELRKGDTMIATDGKAYRVGDANVRRALNVAVNLATTGRAEASEDEFIAYKPIDALTKAPRKAPGPAGGVWDADVHSARNGIKLRK